MDLPGSLLKKPVSHRFMLPWIIVCMISILPVSLSVQMDPIISVVTNSLIRLGLWGWLGTWEMNILWKNFVLFLVA